MKSDKLMDAITEIDEDLLEQAEKEPGAKEREAAHRVIPFSAAWIRRACAGLAIVLLVGASVWMISRQNRVQPGGEETTVMGTETGGIITGGPIGTPAETEPTASADPAGKAAVLAEPKYPEDWQWGAYPQTGELRPAYVRQTAGKEAADLYRSFFADIMLKLLSDNEEDSSVMSPVNVFMAAAMLAQISGGETRQEVLSTLGVSSLAELRQQAAKIWGLCYLDNGREKLVLGNSVWLSNRLAYREDTVKQLAESYYASVFRGEMGSEEYNALFQSWLDQMTGGLLKEQIRSMGFQPFTVFALISTVYLKTQWIAPFKTEQTRNAVFYGARGEETVPFMNQKRAANAYYQGENWRMVRLQTVQGWVWFFLPDEGSGVAAMMQTESFRNWLAHTDQTDVPGIEAKEAIVHVSVPKLDIDATLDLIDSLTALGIRNAFDPGQADLSPLLGGSGGCIDSAEQKSRLVMDENGVEAASVVAMSMAAAAPQAPEFDFVLDRPFFLLVTGANEVPLFAAVVNTMEP